MTILSWFVTAFLAVTSAPQAPAAPGAVHEIQVVARKFSFEPAAIEVVAGERVRLVIRSADSAHGFAIKPLKINAFIPKGGGAVTVEFTAPAAGSYEIACSEICGSGHRHMKAALVSVDPAAKPH
jgi:cytochrome c oxidase subunit II